MQQEIVKWAVNAGVEHQQWKMGTFFLKARHDVQNNRKADWADASSVWINTQTVKYWKKDQNENFRPLNFQKRLLLFAISEQVREV